MEVILAIMIVVGFIFLTTSVKKICKHYLSKKDS